MLGEKRALDERCVRIEGQYVHEVDPVGLGDIEVHERCSMDVEYWLRTAHDAAAEVLQQVDVCVVSGSARQRRRPRVHREARAQHSPAGVGLDVGAAIIEVFDSHAESELHALDRESFECELVKTLAGNSAIGDR